LYYLHASLEVTMSVIRQKYWVIHCRSTIKRVIHSCIPCVRSHKELCQEVIADLPAARVTMAPVFARVGVDFTGPITTKPVGIRTRTVTKSYLALFVCMTTKSIHLEVVSDLTTEGFKARPHESTHTLSMCAHAVRRTNFHRLDGIMSTRECSRRTANAIR